MLWSSYNGQRKGEALADVLLGKVQPERPPAVHLVRRHRAAARDHRLRDPAHRDQPRAAPTMYFTGPLSLPVRLRPELHRRSRTRPARGRRRRSTPTTPCRSPPTSPTRARSPGTDVVQLYVTTPDAPAALAAAAQAPEGFSKVSLAPGQTKTSRSPSRSPTWPSSTRRTGAGWSTRAATASRSAPPAPTPTSSSRLRAGRRHACARSRRSSPPSRRWRATRPATWPSACSSPSTRRSSRSSPWR